MADGLGGRYIAFDDQGKPWGVLDFGGDVTASAEVIELPTANYRREFAEYLVGECNLSAATAFTYETGFRRIEKWLGDREITGLDVPEIREFLRKSDYHPATKNSTLVAIKALHKWAGLEGLPWANADVLNLRGPKQVRNPKPALEPEEAATLLELCRSPHEFRAVWLPLYAGTRVSESARIGEAEWLSDRLRFYGKGRKQRDVPLHEMLADKRSIILSKSATADGLKHVCRSLSFVSGIDFTSHTLRRTFSRTWRRGGAPREVPSAAMGHAPATVNEGHYDPVEYEELVEWMPKLQYPVKRTAKVKR